MQPKRLGYSERRHLALHMAATYGPLIDFGGAGSNLKRTAEALIEYACLGGHYRAAGITAKGRRILTRWSELHEVPRR